MQKDFHFWGTFYAARAAGFEKPDADVIAYAAQHVDDNHGWGDIILKDERSNQNYLFSRISSENMMEAPGSKPKDVFRQVWVVFHFPPGNYLSYDKRDRIGHETRHFRGSGQKGMFGAGISANIVPPADADLNDIERPGDDLSKQHFPLICRPHSDLVVDMINDTMYRYHSRHYGRPAEKGEFDREHANDSVKGRQGLYLIGVRMHVFADSWAHQDFVGASDREFNHKLDQKLCKKGEWSGFAFNFSERDLEGSRVFGSQPFAKDGYREQNLWLGHGAMGSWPDRPWYVFSWKPGWSNEPVVRNNPSEFLQAWINLVNALVCIRKGNMYTPVVDPGTYETNIAKWTSRTSIQSRMLLDKVKGILTDCRETSPDKRGKYWEKVLGPALGKPNEYNEKRLESVLRNSQITRKDKLQKGEIAYTARDFAKSDFFYFQHAAKTHYRFVRDTMRSQGFRLVLCNEALSGNMIDDFEAMQERFKAEKDFMSIIILSGVELFRCTKNEEMQVGLELLCDDLKACKTAENALKIIDPILAPGGELLYFGIAKDTSVKEQLRLLDQQLKHLRGSKPRPASSPQRPVIGLRSLK